MKAWIDMRWKRRTEIFCVACCLLTAAALAQTQRVDRQAPTIAGYTVDAELAPAAHHLSARTVVAFTAPEQAETIVFGFHPALKILKISDESGRLLSGERLADGSIRVHPATPPAEGQMLRWSFEYEGKLTGHEEGPVEGLKLAAIDEPTSYLLYAARWLPTAGYLTNRFTATMHIRAPQGVRVFASGAQGEPQSATLSNGQAGLQYAFDWPKAGFPGAVIAGRYLDPVSLGAGHVKVYLTAAHQAAANELAQQAARQYEFFSDRFGAPESSHLNVVELPDDTLPSAWAPELAAIPGARMSEKSGVRLLANTIARQWWGEEISPRTLNDAWITNGMARYAELLYLEEESGKAALKAALADVSAGALAYDTIPLSSAGRLSAFSPEQQSMTFEKGAMTFHMLRWTLGEKRFQAVLRATLVQHAGGSIRSQELIKIAEAQSQQPLTAFFSQWIDSTGAPRFANQYAIYRLGDNKGFRTVGEVTQDLELFRMPVELRVETDGKTESQRVEVSGANAQYQIETFGRPRRIVIDPDNWLLKSTPELDVRVSILKGQQLAAQGDLTAALNEFQKALEANPISSLASYRIAETLYNQRNYQAAVNAYRDCLRGDGEPKWTEVWSHLRIGQIFDLTGQRDRAVNEYRLALQTNDNTQGALNEARQDLQTPFKRPEAE